MYSVTDIMFWISLLGIFVSFFVAFYIPGRVLIGGSKIRHKNAVPVLAVMMGITLWAWQGYLFGLVHLRFLSYLYLLIFAGMFFYKKYYSELTLSLPSLKKVDLIVLLIAIFGIGAQMIPFLQMGLKTQQGVMLMSINREDHVWHSGLIRELVDRFPPNEPGMAGVVLKDYHYWFNLLTAELIRVFHLPPFQTQFIGMYLLASVLLLFVGYYFAKLIYDKKLFIRLFLFFLFFGGDAGLWVMLVWQHKITLSLSSLFNDSTKFLDRPVFAFSILIGLTALYLLFQTKEKISKRMIFIIALLFSSLMEFKVYTGITFMLGLATFSAYSIMKKRFDRVAIGIFAAILGASIFFPNTSSASGLFFLPFEVPRDFITQPIFGLHDWELRWRIYQDHANYIRIVQYGLYMTGLYVLIQFGIQLLGLFPWKKTMHILSVDRILPLYTIVLSGLVLGLLFFQTVGGANIWEFFLPVITILSLFTSIVITSWLENKNRIVQVIVVLAVIVIVIPRWLISVNSTFRGEYLSGFHGISNDEYLSYQYLDQHVSKNDIVMVVNDPSFVAIVSVVKPLSGSQLYFSGEGVRQRITPEIVHRREVLQTIRSGDNNDMFTILKNEHIKYLYYYGAVPEKVTANPHAKIVFHDKISTIIRLDL